MIIKNSQILLSSERQFNNSSSTIDARESVTSQDQATNQNGTRQTTMLETNIELSSTEQSAQKVKQDSYSTIFHEDGSIVSLSNHHDHLDESSETTSTIYSRRMLQQLQLQPTLNLQSAIDSTQANQPVINNVGITSDNFSSLQTHQYKEHEELNFTSIGEVILEDGRKIQLNFNQALERDYLKKESAQITHQEVNFIDPLVINYDTNATAVLGDEHFDFDMNNDGQEERLTFAASGSGFLVLDKNSDGVINHGGEVFGGVTGNGFNELAKYDTDDNLWIDENDAVFSQLQIWTNNSTNEQQLMSLKDAGIGAIYLNSSSGEYTFTDHHNNAKGKVQQSGIFLKENGEVGSIMQIDLATQNQPLNGLMTENSIQDQLVLSNERPTTQFSNPLVQPTNAVEEDFVSDWFTFEDELKALNKFIERLSSGEANLADIGLFLSSGVTNQVNLNNFNKPLSLEAIDVSEFSNQIRPFSGFNPMELNTNNLSDRFINAFSLQSNLANRLDAEI